MAITEPTGWELICDNCGTRMDIDADPGDQATLERWAREDDGWIVVMKWHYCSLDCLLRHRRFAHVRWLQAGYAADLARRTAALRDLRARVVAALPDTEARP